MQAVDVVQVTEDDLCTLGRHPYPTGATHHINKGYHKINAFDTHIS